MKNVVFGAICLTALAGVLAFVTPRQLEPSSRVEVANASEDVQSIVQQVDSEFVDYWRELQIQPASAADDLTIARRLSLALTGSIPSLEEIRQLESLDQTHPLSDWARGLLSDRRHTDYFAERLARAYVGIDNGPFLIYRRRRFVSWLSDQLLANAPYNALVRTLITADGLWTDAPEVNFFTVNSSEELGGRPDPIRMAGRTTRAFLAVRLDCVQCHDDNLGGQWLQSNFHELAAYFSEPTPTFVGIRDRSRAYETKYLHDENPTRVQPRVPFAAEIPNHGTTRREQLAEWVTHPTNRAFARAMVNRVWALAFGRPLVEPVDNIPLSGPYPPGMESLANDFVAHGYDLRRLWITITSIQPFRVDSRTAQGATLAQDAAWAVFPVTRLRPEQVAGGIIQSGRLSTTNADSHVVIRAARYFQILEFVQRFGDMGQDEFNGEGGTIPQRLAMLNGKLVKEVTGDGPITNASSRIANLSQNDNDAIDAAFLTVLTRRPNDSERARFLTRLHASALSRIEFFEDLHWTLLNSSEFSWNH